MVQLVELLVIIESPKSQCNTTDGNAEMVRLFEKGNGSNCGFRK